MSVTDDFRAELDKHDVTWVNVTPLITGFVVGGKAYRTYEYDGMDDMDGLQLLSATPLTPQEVIAATLGRGTCVPILNSERDRRPYLSLWFVCSECGCRLTENRLGKVWQKFCPNCGRKVVDE